MKWIKDLLDGDITKSDLLNAASRISIIIISIMAAAYFYSIYLDNSTELDLKMNPHYLIAENKDMPIADRLEAMDELSKMTPGQITASFAMRLSQTLMMLFVLSISSSLIAYGFSRIKWSSVSFTKSDSIGHIAIANPHGNSTDRMRALVVIFATVFISGSLILMALS